MPNTSGLLFRFTLLTIMSILTYQFCTPNINVPQFYTTIVSLQKFMKHPRLSSKQNQKLVYIGLLPIKNFKNYPESTIKTAVSPHSIDINEQGTTFQYFIQQQQRNTSILFKIQHKSTEKWRKFLFTIFASSSNKIAAGYTTFQNPELRLSSFITGKLPTNFKPTNSLKSFAFINGIECTRKIPQKPTHHILLNVSKVDTIQSFIQIKVEGSQATIIRRLKIGYIVIEINNKFQMSLESTSIQSNGVAANYYLLDSSIVTDNIFIGVSGLDLIPNKGQIAFSLGIFQDAQNVLSLQSRNKIKIQLKVLRIGNKIQDICSSCINQNVLSVYGSTIKCVSSCNSNQKLVKQANKNVQKCLLCPQILFYQESRGSCICKNGLIKNNNGVCQDPKNINALKTFSILNSDCIQPNTYRVLNRCQCRPGYQKKKTYNIDTCQPICQGNSFHNGFTCVQCLDGTYASNQVRNCIECSNFCSICSTQYTCQKCSNGFQLTQTKACKEICGDGQIFNDECDDGNLINGDGCSSNCKAQQNFECLKFLTNRINTSSCRPKSFKALFQSAEFNSNNLVLAYLIKPNIPWLTAHQLQNLVKVKIYGSTPSRIFKTQNKNNPNQINIIFLYSNLPKQLPEIQTQFKFFDNSVFSQFINRDRIYRRSLINHRG